MRKSDVRRMLVEEESRVVMKDAKYVRYVVLVEGYLFVFAFTKLEAE